MIAIFGNSQDPHTKEICQRLHTLGHSCTTIFTSRENLTETSFVFSCHQEQMPDIKITQNGSTISTNEIHAAWVTQPIFPLFSGTEEIFSQDLKFWFFTWRESLEGIYSMLEFRGVLLNKSVTNAISHQNKIHYISKPLTTHLKQPRTIVSNRRESLLKFFDIENKPVILKTLHQMQLTLAGEPTMLLASIVERKDFLEFQQKGECPILLQEYIDKAYDIRLTIVGNRIFACKIDATQSDAGRIDWRAYDLANTPHTAYNLPQVISEEIIRICAQLNLDYATIDLCVNHMGNYYLLDINPFGKYLWIEYAIGAPITDAIAQLLIQKSIQPFQGQQQS